MKIKFVFIFISLFYFQIGFSSIDIPLQERVNKVSTEEDKAAYLMSFVLGLGNSRIKNANEESIEILNYIINNYKSTYTAKLAIRLLSILEIKRGYFKRILVINEKSVPFSFLEKVRASYEFSFLNDYNGKPIETMEEFQSEIITPILNEMESFAKTLKAVPSGYYLPFTQYLHEMSEIHDKEYWNSATACSVDFKLSPLKLSLSNCIKLENKSRVLSRADIYNASLSGDLNLVFGNFANLFKWNGLEIIRLLSHDFELRPQDQAEILDDEPEFGLKRNKQSVKKIKDLALVGKSSIKLYQKVLEKESKICDGIQPWDNNQFCGLKNGSSIGFRENIFSSFGEGELLYLENIASDGTSIPVQFNFMQMIENPKANLKGFLGTKFDNCGQVLEIGDPSLSGLVVSGDAKDFMYNHPKESVEVDGVRCVVKD